MAEVENLHHEHEEGGHHFEVVEHGVHIVHSSKKEIWRVFFILLGITLLEFLIALTHKIREGLGKELVVAVFLFLTVLKAFYIVGNFMHLKHERINMIYTILLPIMFIVYLIALLIYEGAAQPGTIQ
jgi:cytochrome c oxidase subunit IV